MDTWGVAASSGKNFFQIAARVFLGCIRIAARIFFFWGYIRIAAQNLKLN
jgi:hypothetical protein